MWTTVTSDSKQITDYQFRRVTIDLGRGDMQQGTLPCQDMEDFLGGIGRAFKLLGGYEVTDDAAECGVAGVSGIRMQRAGSREAVRDRPHHRSRKEIARTDSLLFGQYSCDSGCSLLSGLVATEQLCVRGGIYTASRC